MRMHTNRATDSPIRTAKALAIFFDVLAVLGPRRSIKNSAVPKLATMAIRAMVMRYGMKWIIG